MNEHSPIIAFDRNLGQHVDYIDVDYDELVTYMQERGFDDEIIAATNIEVHSTPNSVYNKASKNTYFTQASFNSKTEKIDMYPRDRIDDYQAIRSGMPSIKSMFDDYMSNDMNADMAHELEHKLIKLEGGMNEEKKYQRKIVGRQAMYAMGAAMLFSYGFNQFAEAINVETSNPLVSISTIGMSMATGALLPTIAQGFLPGARQRVFNRYVNSPEEVRCREIEESAPKLMTIVMSNADDKAMPEAA